MDVTKKDNLIVYITSKLKKSKVAYKYISEAATATGKIHLTFEITQTGDIFIVEVGDWYKQIPSMTGITLQVIHIDESEYKCKLQHDVNDAIYELEHELSSGKFDKL